MCQLRVECIVRCIHWCTKSVDKKMTVLASARGEPKMWGSMAKKAMVFHRVSVSSSGKLNLSIVSDTGNYVNRIRVSGSLNLAEKSNWIMHVWRKLFGIFDELRSNFIRNALSAPACLLIKDWLIYSFFRIRKFYRSRIWISHNERVEKTVATRI